MAYRRVASFKTADDFAAYLAQSRIDIAFDAAIESGPGSPLEQPYRLPDGFTIGNRFCVCRWRVGTEPPTAARRS